MFGQRTHVSGGEEIHGLGDLEGETEEVVQSQNSGVTEEDRRPLLVWKRKTVQ